jgi:hypothetical protein
MVKFDPEGFKAMMGRIAAEEQAEAAGGRYEDLEPDYEYMATQAHCTCACH